MIDFNKFSTKYFFINLIYFYCISNQTSYLKETHNMQIKVHIVKSFTNDCSQGNPVGIVFDADNLTHEQMMSIVQKTGYSECAFIQKSAIATVKARFFSQKKEMNLCGHATIALFHLLDHGKSTQTLTQETLAGVLSVSKKDDGMIEMEQADPTFYQQEYDVDTIAQLLGVASELIINVPIRVSTGTPKLLVELKDIATLWSLNPNFELIKELVPTGIYAFVKINNHFYNARQFNPSTGVNEDPVTGVAAGALGAYLKKCSSLEMPIIVEQGHMLGRIGQIYVDTSNGIKVGGYAILVGTFNIELLI